MKVRPSRSIVSRPVRLEPDLIRTDAGTQTRAHIDEVTVREYAEAMRRGDKFPPRVVFENGGDFILADGCQAGRASSGKTICGMSAGGEQSRNQKANPMRMKLFCLATWAMSMTAANLHAQTTSVLHGFTGAEGGFPAAVMILSSNTLYGTTSLLAGNENTGTVFKVNTDGTGFTTLCSFTGGTEAIGKLLLSGNTLYGTTYANASGSQTLFKVNTDATGFGTLYSFTNVGPNAALILSGNTLYGTARVNMNTGTVFKVNTDGTSFTTLFSLTSSPPRNLVLSGSTFYGTTYQGGGVSNYPTVFKVNTDGTSFTVLYSFTGNDGAYPNAGLVLSGNALYGTTYQGGSGTGGTVFKVNTDGSDFATLYSFTFTNGGWKGGAGAYPNGDLVLSGNTLYGTTQYGTAEAGGNGYGTVFKVNTDATGFTTLYNFTSGNDGAYPAAGLVSSGNTLYGTAEYGGSGQHGTVFSLNVNGLGGGTYLLVVMQSATNVTGPYSTFGSPTILTNPVTPEMYFKLSIVKTNF
jgi:uncharacterized repeat protein (TIGR03803 family)